MAERKPTIRGRELGAELKNLRTNKGMTLEELSADVKISVSKLSRMENGIRGARPIDVAALLALFRVGGRRRDELLELCEGSDKTGWLQRFGENLPPVLKSLVNQESEAVRIRNFETMVIPGLLQTDEYARAVLRGFPTIARDEIEERIAARRARQVILSRERPPVFESIITESALRCPVGGPIVMAGQLRWLVERAKRPHISIQVLPTSIGAHAGMAGPFIIMDFRGVPSIVHLENQTSSLSLEEKPETCSYRMVYEQLNEDALSQEDSVAFIATLANEIAETI